MTLNQLGALVSHLLTQLAVLINPISAILALVGITTKEKSPYLVQNEVLAIGENLSSGTYGLAVLAAGISALQTSVDSLGSPQQATSPVILPVTPPSAYIAPTSADNASAVWSAIEPVSGYAYGSLLGFAGMVAYSTSTFGLTVLGELPWFVSRFPLSRPGFDTIGTLPVLDPTAHVPGNDLVADLNAQNAGWDWAYLDSPYGHAENVGSPGGSQAVQTTIDNTDWLIICAGGGAAVINPNAPIWPGLAGVELGSAVALADGLVVTGPLAGVIVTITSVPTPISYYPFGSIRSYVRAGAVMFTEDNGDSEFAQPLGPSPQIILPKSMVFAASATFRVPSGVVGTVTPFTIP